MLEKVPGRQQGKGRETKKVQELLLAASPQ